MDIPSDAKRFNTLERAILDWFVGTYKDAALTAQIKAASLKERKRTKGGFYIELEVPSNLAPVDVAKINSTHPVSKPSKTWPVEGPLIKSIEVDDGGGSLLWGTGGHITTIELYAFDRVFGEDVKTFKLHKVGDPGLEPWKNP